MNGEFTAEQTQIMAVALVGFLERHGTGLEITELVTRDTKNLRISKTNQGTFIITLVDLEF